MRVFIAEDNLNELEYLKFVLGQQKDINIIGEATTGQKALRSINKLKPDVAFLDISMPGISGLSVAKLLFMILPSMLLK